MTTQTSAPGARPEGTTDEQSAAIAVREMFDTIAPRYDLLNHVLSLNIDRYWWWRASRAFRATLAEPSTQILDLCCGTGDMTLALLKRRPADSSPIFAADFSHQMLVRGHQKFSTPIASGAFAIAIEADALHLPFADNSLDLVTAAFGFRNIANYAAALAELHRVLRPGAQFGILDFAEPGGLIGKLYAFYFRNILPRIGAALSGTSSPTASKVASPYAYLPSSVHRFPPPAELLSTIRATGFTNATWTPYTFGTAGLFRATKP